MRFPISDIKFAECEEVKVVENGNVIIKKVLYKKDGTEVVISARTLDIDQIDRKMAVLENQKTEAEELIAKEK